MRIVVLYRLRSEHEGKVIAFVEEYKRVKRVDLEKVNLDTREGSEMARLYGITQYPAVLAITSDGSLQKHWEGDMLPMMNELEYYTLEASRYSLKSHNARTLRTPPE